MEPTEETSINNKSKSKDLSSTYINSLNESERLVLEIAKEHLQSSFNLLKSVGYQLFIKK